VPATAAKQFIAFFASPGKALIFGKRGRVMNMAKEFSPHARHEQVAADSTRI
jgi:hypothetical protein